MADRYLAKDADMLDWICWRYYGRQAGAVELVLEANPGLAALGARLPAGITVLLPKLPAPETSLVRLWD